MIYYHTIYPESVHGELLDRFLAGGWYRIGQSCITTDLITEGDRLIPVFWLRINLARYRASGSARRILAKNAFLKSEILPFELNEEIESLYASYRKSISHSILPSAKEYLLEGLETNPYDTRLIEVRDGSRLVAAGYFDVGEKCSAGILHMFHPEYASHSLGKYLFLREIDWSIRRADQYYYPGYFSTETPKFDYKLFADPEATEVYLRPLNRWVPFSAAEGKLRRWGQKIAEAASRIFVSRA